MLSDYIRMPQESAFSYVANALIAPSVCSDSPPVGGVGRSLVPGAVGPAEGGTQHRGLGRSPSLVINTEIAAISNDKAAIAARLEPWKLLSVVRELLPDRRVKWCFRKRISKLRDVDVYHNIERGTLRYGNLIRCGMSQVCPCCARVDGERVRGELAQAVAWGRAQGYEVLFTTFTVSHGRGDALPDVLNAVTSAYRSMAGNRAYRELCKAYGVDHVIRGLEVTFGGWNGAHPHFHALQFAQPGLDVEAYQEQLAPAWIAPLADQGFTASLERGVHVKVSRDKVEEYIAKWDRLPSRRPWDTADEVGKPNSKHGRGDDRLTPFDLLRKLYYGRQALDELEGRAAGKMRHHLANYEQWFKDYDGAVFHRHRLQYSRGLRAVVGLPCAADDMAVVQADVDRSLRVASLSVDDWLNDDAYTGALAEEDKPVSVEAWLASVPFSDWRAVDRLGVQGELLETFRMKGVDAARAFVADVMGGRTHGA